MNRAAIFASAFASVLLTLPASAGAATLSPTSYSMINGDYFTFPGYGDEAYSNSSCPGYPGLLCGGLGELTDGITVPSFAGSDNYKYMVGWGSGPGTWHTINFFFDGAQDFGQVGLHLSNYGPAGILLPSSVEISVGGDTPVAFTVDPSADTGNHWLYFNIVGSGSTVDVKLFHGEAQWLFIDEAVFESSGAPEPATWVMLLGALGCLAFARRHAAARL